MKKNIVSFISTLLILAPWQALADEGMWLLMLLKKQNEAAMQSKGLKLSADDIYNLNRSSLKDAVVNFGNFCTGEVISEEGLVLTNHHCGYDAIQSQSSVQADYLTEGFWAKSKAEEKPVPGLTITFLIRMEDVTAQVQEAIKDIDESGRDEAKEKVFTDLQNKATEGTHYTAEVKPFFEGNEYYLFVYEVFKDIRWVGAPPESIGKFGGDTDNWMWPRHTGDFSMFRIYAGADNKPADYAAGNIPFKPRHAFPVSLKGVERNDFAMVMGYPGSTERYQCMEGVKMTEEQSNPTKIKLREKRLALMKEDMDKDPAVRIKYASKYAQVSNYYKYFIGQNQGLKRLKIAEKKGTEEEKFNQWVNADPERKDKYGKVLSTYSEVYKIYRNVNVPYIYLEEGAFGTEILLFAYKNNEFYAALASKETEKIKNKTAEMKKLAAEHFKDYHAPTDQKIFAALLKMYYEDVNPALHPGIFETVKKKYKGDFEKYAQAVFSKSILASSAKYSSFLASPSAKVLEKDPAYMAMSSILNDFRAKLGPYFGHIYGKLETNGHLFVQGMREMNKDKTAYPDANFTLRLTYGTVQDYFPRDAVYYNYFTTLDGIMEKEDPGNPEFIVPSKLKELYKSKDYGPYVDKNGSVPVCFITTNDITGGNSGSPVLNGKGELIGIAFDGNWEAMSGDIVYEPDYQRCIATDIRYVLFVVDKYAGAGYLLKEMKIVKE